MPLPVYLINLKERKDRLAFSRDQFDDKPQFTLHVFPAIKHQKGNVGLWQTIQKILQYNAALPDEFIIISEDDHQFTSNYSFETLITAIAKARSLNADIVLGGVSWFSSALKVSDELFWAERFTGTQFTIIFRRFFDVLLNASFYEEDTLDSKITALTGRIFFIYPFISVQKDFGYSDATTRNNRPGMVQELFDGTIDRLKIIEDVYKFYDENDNLDATVDLPLDNVVIPAYIINLPERTERFEHIKKQFENRNEFDITIVEACKHETGAVGLWLSIRKIIQMALANDDDVIIICEDDHEFTPEYSRDYLLTNIIEAHQQACEYLSGGSGKFELAIPLTKNRFWTNHCLSTQFIILYRKFFQKILDEPFDDSIIADIKLSEMTSNKMLLYPYVSTQKDFGYSDVTASHNADPALVTNLFNESRQRLSIIQQTWLSLASSIALQK